MFGCCIACVFPAEEEVQVAASQLAMQGPLPASGKAADLAQMSKLRIKAPEGVFNLVLDRRAGIAFQPDLGTKLTRAELAEGENYFIFNIGQKLYVLPASAIESKARP
jgi:hypothetical protein